MNTIHVKEMNKFIWSDKKHSDYLEKGVLRHLHRARLSCIDYQLDEILTPLRNARCLDLGCGDGLFIKHFQSRGFNGFIGCDADFDRLLRARNCCLDKTLFINTLAEDTPFRSHSFDLILLHHLLEHVHDDRKILAECCRLLKHGGFLVLGVPNEGSIAGRILRFLHPKLYKKGEHVNFYSEKQILGLLRNFNFKIVNISRVGFLFPQYYIHMLLVSNKITFSVGDFLTKTLKFTADSLLVTCHVN